MSYLAYIDYNHNVNKTMEVEKINRSNQTRLV